MTSEQQYSSSNVRKSISHFVVGKIAAGALGISILLLQVRVFATEDYALLIGLLALFEITTLATNLGAMPAVYRYIPEARHLQQNALLRRLIIQLSAYRATTLLFASLLFAVFAPSIAQTLGAPALLSAVALYGLVIFIEGMARHTDTVFEVLLHQKQTQISILIRNIVRLAGILFLSFYRPDHLLFIWISIEIFASSLGLLYAIVSLKRLLPPASDQDVPLPLARMFKYAAPAFAAQAIGILQGPDLVKILIGHLDSPQALAAFGFVAALAATVQRYLPSFLLAGLVRPLFVAAQSKGHQNDQLVMLANVVFKLNLMILMPAAALAAIQGDRIVEVLSSQKISDAGIYLFLMMIWLIWMAFHNILNLLTLAKEDGVSSLYGTILGGATLVAASQFYAHIGTVGLCAALIVAEVMWAIPVLYSLRAKGLSYSIQPVPLLRLLLATALTTLLAWEIKSNFSNLGNISFFATLALTALAFVAISAILKPFSQSENTLINKALPKKLFIW